MQDYTEQIQNLIIKIDAIVEYLDKDEDGSSLLDRNRLRLILINLSNSLKECDSNYVLKPLLDQASSQLSNIESNVKQKKYNTCETYLYEIIKILAHLNNANGKPSLKGYQQAVNRNVRVLEDELQKSLTQIETLKASIADENEKLNEVKSDTNTVLSTYKESYERDIQELTQKYEDFIRTSKERQEDIHKTIDDDQQTFKNEYTDRLLELKEEISETKSSFKSDMAEAIDEFETDKKTKLDELTDFIEKFIQRTNAEIESLKTSATEKIGYVASATHSNIYQKYSDRASDESKWWYVGTIASMLALIGLSMWWFVFTHYSNTDYIALIARVCATVGVAVISRYCAIQASKSKVIETKLRKIQLQMGTFDAFVASLDKSEQDRLKIELTEKLISQKDWLIHDKDEIDIIKDFEKLVNKFGYTVKISNKDETDTE
ncbi:MAG: apolipoprotein A1/A4/E family protein [Clostridia bacterium]|nr:apolipoprotein A1/A4/E family protein [Clostridia bacterium]